MPDMPSPFTPFLEEKPDSEENLKHLEHQAKTHLRNSQNDAGKTKTD